MFCFSIFGGALFRAADWLYLSYPGGLEIPQEF
jgi:hypothetical protein